MTSPDFSLIVKFSKSCGSSLQKHYCILTMGRDQFYMKFGIRYTDNPIACFKEKQKQKRVL